MKIDINCDMGEGMDNDKLLMPYIHSANIACGFHAGDEATMKKTIQLALQYGVSIGAHVSFADKANFGRTEMNLPIETIYELVQEQLVIFCNIATQAGATVQHVKPHGALYNMSAANKEIAAAIAKAVKDFDNGLILYGLSGSFSIREAKKINLSTASEVFADRTYQDDGSLTPRFMSGALIEDEQAVRRQVIGFITDHTVIALSGKKISIDADTICIHGDGSHALPFAKLIASIVQ